MSVDPVNLWPNNNTLYCIIHGGNVLASPIDNHHGPIHVQRKNDSEKMPFKSIVSWDFR